jgi:hypothetical protein
VPDARYQGEYAEMYIKSLALSAGLNVLTYAVDDGIDAMVRYTSDDDSDSDELRSWPGVDLQVKSWSTPSGSADYWTFDRLNEKQFNKLAGDHVHPRYLVVLLVPEDRLRLAEVVSDGLLLRHLAYYTSVSGPRILGADSSRRKSVRVPKRNVLTAAELRKLISPELSSMRSLA